MLYFRLENKVLFVKEKNGATPDEHPFLTTMRIDIPPDQLAKTKAGRAPTVTSPRQPVHKVIKIPSQKWEPTKIGGANFQQLLQNIYDAVLITDPDGNVVEVNSRALQFFKCDSKDLCGRRVIDIISGADTSLLNTIRNTLESDRFVLIQAYCRRHDGTVFAAEISVNRLSMPPGEYLNFFVRDITVRKEAEDRLRTGFNAIQNSGSGIAIADVEANLVYCNPVMERMLGLNEGESHGMNLKRFLPDESQTTEIIKHVLKGNVWSDELKLTGKNGAQFFVQASVAPNLDTEGDLDGMVLSILDISRQKQAQLQLASYARELQEKNTQMENDLNMAREIQLSFLPREYPVFPARVPSEKSALRFSHLYIPSGMVGGDFFDVFEIPGGKAGVFMADVSGHGLRAALVVATLYGLIEELMPHADDPGVFLTKINKTYTGIFKLMEDFLFVTAFYLVLDLKTGEARHASAGHPRPFFVTRRENDIRTLSARAEALGPAIGLFPDVQYSSDECRMVPGDLLLLYTDGLFEERRADGDEFGLERLQASFRQGLNRPLSDMLNTAVADVKAFSGNPLFDDDICLLAMEVMRLLDTAEGAQK